MDVYSVMRHSNTLLGTQGWTGAPGRDPVDYYHMHFHCVLKLQGEHGHHPKDDTESDYPVRDAAWSSFMVVFELLQFLLDWFPGTFSMTRCADMLALCFESTCQTG